MTAFCVGNDFISIFGGCHASCVRREVPRYMLLSISVCEFTISTYVSSFSGGLARSCHLPPQFWHCLTHPITVLTSH